MGFYLLGRGHDNGEIRLISDTLFADRKSALEALSRLSSAAGFEHGDAEVFVADLDQAMPVLVVAAQAPASEVAAKAAPGETPDEVVASAEPEAVDSADEVVEVETPEPIEPETEAIVVEEPLTEEIVTVDSVIEDIVAEPGTPSLSDALKNATTSLEAEGIVAPESVGPAAPDEPEAWPWESAPAEPAAEVVEPAAEVVEPAAEVVEPAAEVVEPAAEVVEPAAYVPDPFEEPAVDAGDLVTGVGADVDAARTVVMGAYVDETPAAPAAPVADFEQVATVEPVMDAVATFAADSDDDEITGMLADLETIEAPARDAAELTCGDCVYVNTCPNKDELEPGACGNFQWKSV